MTFDQCLEKQSGQKITYQNGKTKEELLVDFVRLRKLQNSTALNRYNKPISAMSPLGGIFNPSL